jgi:hypothetical protein
VDHGAAKAEAQEIETLATESGILPGKRTP